MVFGIYMMGQGAVLLLAPQLLLAPVGVAVPTDAWVRVVGWCLLVLGTYYLQAARTNRGEFFKLSVIVRFAQFGFFGVLVATGLAPAIMLAFSGVEAASGGLTALALRQKAS